ncbi:MAG: hypothetical protein OXD45_11525 [Rhodobacteraceae bacterium]|nr:hypothetical protein [Paracoccaceae bacterium]
MVPPVPSANHLPPPMTGDGDHIAGQGTGPSVGVGAAQDPPLGGVSVIIIPDARPAGLSVGAAPVGPNRGVIVSHGTAVNRDASGGTPATQAVARIKRGQGADREAPVAAVVNREIGDGVGATRHEAAPQQDVRYFIYIDLVNMRRFIGQQNCRIGRTGKVRIG